VGAHHQALRGKTGLIFKTVERRNLCVFSVQKLTESISMNRKKMISTAIKLIALGAISLSGMHAFAQQKPIRLVVPYAAGGPIDVTARLIAEQVKTSLGTVIVDNKPGAGGNIGADLVAKATADGTTIGIAALATHAINPWLYAKMPYDAGKDFAPITQMLRVPNVLVMNADTAKRLNINTLQEFVAYAKANPGKLNFASGGNGSGGHLAGEMFKQRAGVFAVHIPYNGGNPAQLALLSGQVDFNFDNLATAAPNIRSGKLKALAVTTLKRSSAMPDVPALAEVMPNLFSGFSVDTWWGLVAPAGTPADVISKLNAAFTAALNQPDTKTRYSALMAEPSPTSAAEFAAFMQAERAKYEKPVKASGARVD
jgi:tripartite-type tricarboxylate transporter receptor subunit TctC